MRKLMWFAVGFCGACAVGSWFYVSWLWIVGVFVFLLYVGLAAGGHWYPPCKMAAVVVLGCAVGLFWFAVYDQLYLEPARERDGEIITITVEASDYSYDTDFGTAVEGIAQIEGRPYRLKLYLNGEVPLCPGDKVAAQFLLRFTAEGGQKDPTYHRSDGIFLLLYQRDDTLTVDTAEEISMIYYPAVWRQDLLLRIHMYFPEDVAGFACGLLLGDRSGIDYETDTAFSLSGISHIIAVSGLHVSILFGLLYTITMRRRFMTGLIGIPVLLIFAAMAGFSPSITRACIMQILMLIAIMANREYDPPTALAFAVLMMLAANPMTVISISFQLSAGCMVGIFLFSVRIHEWFLDHKRLGSAKGNGMVPRLKRWFVSSVSVTLSASVMTVPLVAWHFGTVSLVSVLTNLLTLWVVTYIFYGIVMACAVSLLSGGIAGAIGWVTAWLVRYVVGTAKVLASFPLSAVYTQSVYIVIWLVGCYLLLAVYLLMKRKNALLLGCCAAVSLCAALMASWLEPMTDGCRVTVLDVGQGQCILLQSEGRTYMVDCGGSSAMTAADTAAEKLLSSGISRLDGIILTHYDDDHAGGLEYFLTRIDTDLLMMPFVEDTENVGQKLSSMTEGSTVYVTEDLTVEFGGAKITVFGPETYFSGNESSLCVLFQRENCDILITGDRGELGEMLLLGRTDLPELELLIAGHHGAAGSTGEELLKKTTPEYVFISVGEDNYYGHPSDKLLSRLQAFGCIIYRTDEHGTIVYRG